MKIWLMFVIFPTFLIAQTFSLKQKLFTPLNLSHDRCIGIKASPIGQKLSYAYFGGKAELFKPFFSRRLSENKAKVQSNNLGNSLTYQTDQNSNGKFSKASLVDLKKAGNSLQWSFYLKYGANVLGIIETLAGYSSAGSEDDDVIFDLSKKSSFTNMLGLGSYALELHSINNIGRTGLYLHSLSNKLSTDNSYLLNETSGTLKKARTYGLVSTGFGIVGGTATMYALGSDIESDAFNKGIIVGGSFGLAAIIFKFISVNNVEDAGITAGKFSEKLKEDWQKPYFDGFSKGLQNYEKHWKTGFSLTLAGAGIAMASAFTGSSDISRIGGFGGLILMFTGNIYMNWVAPYSLGSAGENLRKLEDRLNEN